MLLKKLEEKISLLLNTYDFVVLKGFPNIFLIKLNDLFLFTEELPFNNNLEIDLSLIKKNWVKTLNNINNKTGNILLFETFIFLARNINLNNIESNFVILENNFLDIYPNQSNEKRPDYENMIDSQRSINDNGLFHEFYSESYVINNKYYVRYIDGLYDDFANVSVQFFLNGNHEIKTIRIKENEISPNAVFFNPEYPKFLKFKENLLLNYDSISEVEIVVSNIIINNKDNNLSLRYFIDFLENADITYKIYKTEEQNIFNYRSELDKLLLKYWGSNKFRQLEIYADPDISNEIIEISQATVIEQVIEQYENGLRGEIFRDIFLTAPTGAGKSLLFQLPAIFLSEKYNSVTIVISPLIALMKDQVIALREKRNYEKVAYINSELSLLERDEIIKKIKNNDVSIIYMSPELLLSYDIKTFIGERSLGLLVIDEAHLVTTWGRDFRVDYWYLGYFIRKIRKYSKYNFITLAVTATAIYQGEHDMVFETINSLSMRNPILYIGQSKRKNIVFEINQIPVQGAHEEFKLQNTVKRIQLFLSQNKKSLIYCPWTSQIDSIYNRLEIEQQKLVGKYYGRLDQYSKNDYQQQFRNGEIKTIIATKAFGMGVDIEDIEIVYHHAPSGNLTDYVQEIGRLARKKDLVGKAITDFDFRDLKFTKILYGLSSIKQFQVILVLKKILDIYKVKKKRNMLVSVSDFEYIFNFDNIDVEQKVKSTLLLIENDLLNKYKFNVIIARPKSLFTKVYIRVKNDHHEEFEKRFAKYINKIKKDLVKGGHLYTLDLSSLWENKFQDQSFPMIKKEFFEKKLFQKWNLSVTPQLKFTLVLKENREITFNKLSDFFEKIEKIFSELDGFFSKNDFINKLKVYFDKSFSQRIANLFLSVYSSQIRANKSFRLTKGSFIQSKRVEHSWQYRIINKAYSKVKASIRRKFDEIFSDSNYNFESFIAATQTGLENNKDLFKLAYVLETFDLGTYEVIGGEIPAIFIRINDPLKLERLVKSKYTNEILKEIEERQKQSVKIMEFFFTNVMSNKARWNLIEDYFLGKDILNQKEKYLI